ncbi:hypothetical protein ACQP0I_19005 [Micromonospora carbonacea]|uniref:hypothetical protein n=1 Tax=Micromonospora carbonacea TaxID=47853 RepID=UPI003D988564
MTVAHPVAAEEVALGGGRSPAPPGRPPAPDVVGRLTRPLPALLLVGLLAAGWQLMADASGSALTPGLDDVARDLVDIAASGALWKNVRVTLTRVALGFAAAFVVSVAAGLAMGRSEWLRRFLEPAVLIGLRWCGPASPCCAARSPTGTGGGGRSGSGCWCASRGRCCAGWPRTRPP